MVRALRRHFFTGLVVLLPILLSVYAFVVALRLVGGLSRPLFTYLFLDVLKVGNVPFLIPVVSFLTTLFLICLLGYFSSLFVGRKVINLVESIFVKLPILKEVYLAVKKLLTLLYLQRDQFKSVVYIEYTRKGLYSIGFVTSEIKMGDNKMLSVYIPTTPNPTTGVLILTTQDEIKPADLSVEDAFKLILSGGILAP